MEENFVHLHCHTEFSMLDGMPKVEEYVIKANELGMKGIAVTEHGNLRSYYQLQIRTKLPFEYKGKMYKGFDGIIKPIFGIEFYVTPNKYTTKGLDENFKIELKRQSKDSKQYKELLKNAENEHNIKKRYHVLAFAKNQKGMENIFTLSHLSWKNGFYYRPRIDLNLLKKYSEGIVITTSCIGGWAPDLVINEKDDEADVWLKDVKKIFKDDLYVEIQPHDIKDQIIANKKMIQLADENDIKIIATNDCHYLNKEDFESHNVLLAIQSNDTLKSEYAWTFDSTEFYLKSYEEMKESFFKYHPDVSKKNVINSLQNTMEIYNKCNAEIKIDRKKGILPNVNIPEQYTGENNYLKNLCKEGFKWRKIVEKRAPEYAKIKGIKNNKEVVRIYIDRLKFELDRIFNLKFSKYFLIIYDLINWARSQEIVVGPGRGSSSASLVCYLTGITSIDPIQYDLLFDRFLNKNRVDFPDVDMDFQDDRRYEIFNYLFEKYGEENVCQIGTNSRMKGKAAMLDVARTLEVPISRTFEVNKSIVERSSGDARASQTVEDSFKEFDVCKQYNKDFPDVLKHVRKLEGKARHVGIHAAGIQISPTDISKIVPIEYRELNGKKVKVSSWDWLECQGVGLVKLDVLGLRTLSVLQTAKEYVFQLHGEKLNYEEIDLEDQNVLNNFTNRYFTGIFQFDSIGMSKTCEKLTFTSFEDVIVLNALYRPGSMRSGMATHYIDRKAGEEKIPKLNETYDRITKDTYGVLVYQEQLIKCFVELAGYDGATGDELRKKMAKSYGVETMGREKDKFIDGAYEKSGMDKKEATKLFENMAFFGSYAFNKAHAAAYGVIAYWGMWLKTYYPVEFFQALMYHEKDQKEIMRYVISAREFGIDVKMPDINKSDIEFSIQDEKELRGGLVDIKGVGIKAAPEIVNKQPYNSLYDFANKVNRRVVNKGVIKALIQASAFKSIYENTGVLLAYCNKEGDEASVTEEKGMKPVWEWIIENESDDVYYNIEGGFNFDLSEEDEVMMMSKVVPIPPPKHPIQYYESLKKYMDRNFEIVKMSDFDWNKQRVRFMGVMDDIKYNSVGDFEKVEPDNETKKKMGWGKRYANINLEDETNYSDPQRMKVDTDVFPSFRKVIDKGIGTPVLISARLFKMKDDVKIAFVDNMIDLDRFKAIMTNTDKSIKERFLELNSFERYFVRHPVKGIRKKNPRAKQICSVKQSKSKKFAIIGLIVRIKTHYTRKGKKMAFLDLEDETGSLNVIVWAEDYKKNLKELETGNIVRCIIEKQKKDYYLNKITFLKKYFNFT